MVAYDPHLAPGLARAMGSQRLLAPRTIALAGVGEWPAASGFSR